MATPQDTHIDLRQHRRRKDEAELDITPMIDIVFLLLAFFVVVSKMDPTTAVKMPLARYGVAIPDKSAVILVLEESTTDDPRVYLGKAKREENLASGSISDIEDRIADYVAEQLRSDTKKKLVIIKAEREVKTRHVDMVKRAASRSLEEGQSIYIGIEEE